MRRLAVFDIDGTLTDTNAVDDECFTHAVADVLRLDAAALDWSWAPHITDSGLLRWLAERHRGRRPTPEEADAVRHRFLELLRAQLAAAPARFRPVPGAPTVLRAVRAAGWDVAVATGGWEASARLKLTAIGVDPSGQALASAGDAETRPEILRLAAHRATGSATGPARVVSIGDGVWDVRAAAVLGWPFVGVAAEARADRLRSAGASTILPDLADVAALCAALETAAVPHVTTVAPLA
jgi:phosphoglycolate phosphatase-like HAD superfamily hydrolase